MGAENSQPQRTDGDGREAIEDVIKTTTPATINNLRNLTNNNNAINNNVKRRTMLRQNTANTNSNHVHSATNSNATSDVASPTTSELSRAPSPPLSVCSDLPYISYTDRPIGDSPKIRNKSHSAFQSTTSGSGGATVRNVTQRKSYPSSVKPKRTQSTASNHSIVIVKPGAQDADNDVDGELQRLRNIPPFLPVLRESISSATFTRDPEVLERLYSQHFLNICNRLQMHMNLCATHISSEQNHLVERTKIVSNSITTLFASFVDLQKTYASYAEQFTKVRAISQQLNRCNDLLNENIESLESINNFLEAEDRLEPFVWHTDDNKVRREAEVALNNNAENF